MRNVRTSLFVLLVAVLLGALAAGCGGSSTTTTTASTPSAAPKTSTTGTSTNRAVAQAVAKCKSVVNARSGLSASLKSKLIGICNNAAHGNSGNLKHILGQVCTQIVHSQVPGNAPKALKDQALAACKKAFA